MDSPSQRRETGSMRSGDGSHGSSGPNAGNYLKNCEPAFFAPLSANDEFDIYDIELQIDSGGKAEISVRSRYGGNTRPIYKAEKTVKAHLLGKKKNLNITITRNEAWDSASAQILPGVKGNKYQSIWEGQDLSPRALSVDATQNMVLYRTSRGGSFTMTQSCGSYNPVKLPQPRDCLSHHFFPIHMTNFEAVGNSSRSSRSGSRSGSGQSNTGSSAKALGKPYAGGGYFVFDCHSQGRKELLTTLYCTGYERRHRVRNGDITVAELCLPVLPTLPDENPNKRELPAWARFLKERHAVLYISKRGGEATFYGAHVGMSVPRPQEGNRYALSSGQGQEVVISAVCMMLLSVEHERGDKKWDWMMNRGLLERRIVAMPRVTADGDVDRASTLDSSESMSEMVPSPLMGISTSDGPWTQRPYTPSVGGDSMLIPPADSPVSENTADGPFTPVEERGHYPQGPDHDLQSSQGHFLYPPVDGVPRTEMSDYDQPQYNLINKMNDHSEVPEVQIIPPPHFSPPDQLTKYLPQPPPLYNGTHPPSTHKAPLAYNFSGSGQNVYEFPQAPDNPNPAVHAFPLPVPVHPASLTIWEEDNRRESSLDAAVIPCKEGPKVTGRPKPGEEGGIFW
ncbi:hypothetical protein L218DRAFT_182422 [Marasmius fiardii PR-910]|nr:hypothetical protein L218DRAFT_182422 [Marasmius fiardii PR-910]